jgi:hypothetical protein
MRAYQIRAALCVAALAGLVLLAQTSQGRISGLVSDPQNAVIPGATVTANNEETGVQTKAESNQGGLYVLPFLPPGRYTVVAEAQGFKRYRRQGVTVQTGEELDLPIQLELGQVSETVTVSAQAPLLQSSSATVGQFVENRVVSQMPLPTLRSLDLVRLSANVVYLNPDDNYRKPYFSVAGGRVWNQSFLLDGANNQNMRLGVGQVEADPPMESIREFRVLENNYSAEYGGSSGGVIVSSTKSGTNEFHGSLYELLRNDKLNAANFFAPTEGNRKIKNPLKVNQFGASLGGPVIRNRTHFFTAYEGTRRSEGLNTILTVPTQEQRAGDFSQTFDVAGRLVPVYDPATTRRTGGQTLRDPFPGNVIPAVRFDPVMKQLVNFWPVPNRTPVNRTGAQNFIATRSRIPSDDYVLARLDHAFSGRNRLYVRYMNHFYTIPFTTIYPQAQADTQQNGTFFERSYLASDTHTFGAKLVGELRYQFQDRKSHFFPMGLGTNIVEQIGLKGVPVGNFPIVNVSGYAGLGVGERRQFPIRQHFVGNSWTWIHGSHIVKFGAEIRKSRNIEKTRAQPSGQFNFATTETALPGVGGTGNSFASLLLGFTDSFSISETQQLNRYNWYLSGYLQDDWKLTAHLTWNLGLRWETDTPITDANCRMNSFDPGAINPVSGTPGVVRFACRDGAPQAPYHTDWNNFGPRFGFAWTPGGGRWVVRGGYGIFYEHPFATGVPNSASLGFDVSANLATPDNGVTPAFLVKDGVPISARPAALDASFGAVPIGQRTITSVTYYDRDRPTGYAQQYNLGIQREFPGQVVLEVAYVANLSRKLPVGNVTINQVPPGRMGPGNAQVLRPFPQFTNVSLVRPNLGVSDYHSGMLRLQKGLSAGLNFQASYTWSRNIGSVDDFAVESVGDNQLYQDAYNRRLDRGPNAIDIIHRFIWSSIYDLPFGKGRKFLRAGGAALILGGWSAGAIATVQTGGPFTVQMIADTTNAFPAGALRANVLRNAALPAAEKSVQRWFDTGAFQAPPPYTFGNAGRGILRSDGRANFDISVLKNFLFTERINVQFRSQFFNAFNHPSFYPPAHVMGAPAFGSISVATEPRSIQFALRVAF